jgi:hypothetical protein
VVNVRTGWNQPVLFLQQKGDRLLLGDLLKAERCSVSSYSRFFLHEEYPALNRQGSNLRKGWVLNRSQ